jgi:hypothetical protein
MRQAPPMMALTHILQEEGRVCQVWLAGQQHCQAHVQPHLDTTAVMSSCPGLGGTFVCVALPSDMVAECCLLVQSAGDPTERDDLLAASF